MPELVRFLIRHALIGAGLAVLFVTGLLVFDSARLGMLIWASPSGGLALVLLTIGMAITFASAQMGFAVMLLTEKDPAGDPPEPRGWMQPVPLRRRRRMP